jgi:hypothetical protein
MRVVSLDMFVTALLRCRVKWNNWVGNVSSMNSIDVSAAASWICRVIRQSCAVRNGNHNVRPNVVIVRSSVRCGQH